jgi:hypothetical protein
MMSFQVGTALLLSGVQMFSLSMLMALLLFLPGEKTYSFFKHFYLSFLATGAHRG